MKKINEAMMDRQHTIIALDKIVEILSKLASREDMELAQRINEFLDDHETTGFPKAELVSMIDDIETFGKKWKHIVNNSPKDKLGVEILKLRNNQNDPEIDNEFLEEQGDFDYGVAKNYYPNRVYKPIEFVKKGTADIRQKMNNPRFGDNSLEDVTVNEEFELPYDQSVKLDKLQTILNDAGVSNDEIIAGIGGLKPDAKKRVANAINVPEDKVDFMLRLLSTKLSEEDKKNYQLFNESYRKIMESNDRFGYQDDALGNVTVNDSKTGKSVYITGSEASNLLDNIFRNPENTQEILSNYEHLMENKCWSAYGKQEARQSMSLNIEEKPDAKIKKTNNKAPFAKTVKVSKSRVKSILGEDSAFKKEIDAEDGTFNFPWKLGIKTGTGTASFSLENNKPVVHVISVRDDDGNEISDYDPNNILAQAKKFIPDA